MTAASSLALKVRWAGHASSWNHLLADPQAPIYSHPFDTVTVDALFITKIASAVKEIVVCCLDQLQFLLLGDAG